MSIQEMRTLCRKTSSPALEHCFLLIFDINKVLFELVNFCFKDRFSWHVWVPVFEFLNCTCNYIFKTALFNQLSLGNYIFVTVLNRGTSVYLTNLLRMFDILTQQEIDKGKPYICQSNYLNITINHS